MANTIQIKRGNSEPGAGVLLDGELGFDKANDQLYIGKVDGESTVNVKVGLKNGVGYNEENQESAVVPLNADTLQGLSASAFAPAGYGLGEACIHIDNWDNAQANGWYASSVNGPISGWWWFGRVTNYANIVITQEVWCGTQSAVPGRVMRIYDTDLGGWQPWEWINPPMVAGTEYRTIERFESKPVYAKLVDFGALPNATYKTVSLGTTNGQKIVYCHAVTSSGAILPYTDTANTTVDWMMRVKNANASIITIETKNNYSTLTALVLVKYTKTTD